MGLRGQISQGTMIHQHISTLASKARALLFYGHSNSKQLTFMGWVVMGGASQLFAITSNWLQSMTPILAQNSTNAII